MRNLPEQAGLSQRVLGKRAEVRNSMVSLRKSDKINPSVGALKQLLDDIPMGLVCLTSALVRQISVIAERLISGST